MRPSSCHYTSVTPERRVESQKVSFISNSQSRSCADKITAIKAVFLLVKQTTRNVVIAGGYKYRPRKTTKEQSQLSSSGRSAFMCARPAGCMSEPKPESWRQTVWEEEGPQQDGWRGRGSAKELGEPPIVWCWNTSMGRKMCRVSGESKDAKNK